MSNATSVPTQRGMVNGRASVLALRIRSAALQAQRSKPARDDARAAAAKAAAAAPAPHTSGKARKSEESRREGWSGFRSYLRAVGGTQLLTPVEEKELATAYKTKGDERAGSRLVEANLRLVVKIAEE